MSYIIDPSYKSGSLIARSYPYYLSQGGLVVTAGDSLSANGEQVVSLIDFSPALLNGGFESLGAGPPTFTNWTDESNVAIEAVNIHSGANAVNLTRSGGQSWIGNTSVATIAGQTYWYIIWAKALAGTPSLFAGDSDGLHGNIHVLSNTYAQYVGSFIASSGEFLLLNKTAGSTIFVDDVHVFTL